MHSDTFILILRNLLSYWDGQIVGQQSCLFERHFNTTKIGKCFLLLYCILHIRKATLTKIPVVLDIIRWNR